MYNEEIVDQDYDKDICWLGNYTREHIDIYKTAISLSNMPVWIGEATSDSEDYFGLYTNSKQNDLSSFWQKVKVVARLMELASQIKPNPYTGFTIYEE